MTLNAANLAEETPMHSYQHGRVVIATTPLSHVSADAIIVPRLGDGRRDRLVEDVITAGGVALREALEEALVAGAGPSLTLKAVGLRADHLVIVPLDKEAQAGGAMLERAYETALHKAFETGALTLALPLFLGGQDDDAASAVAVVAAFVEGHPSIERVTLVTADERASYRALAAAGEYL